MRVVDLASATTSTLVLKGIEEFTPPPDTDAFFGEVIELTAAVNPRSGFLVLNIGLPPDHKVNEDAPSSAQFAVTGGVADFGAAATMSLTGTTFPVTIPVDFSEGSGTITADVTVIYCHENAESLCFIQQLRFLVDTRVDPPISSDTITLSYEIELPDF